jgi:HK97 family phage portal protein
MSLLGRAVEQLFLPRGGGSLFMRGTYSGKTVNVRTAMGLVPVYSAVSQIAGATGNLPLIVYKRDGEARARAPKHRAWSLLHDTPNPEQAADEFWELVESHIELWGNAFIWKKRDSLGLVRELWVLAPSRIGVTRDVGTGQRIFSLDGHPFGEDTILQIRNLSPDGLVGYSPIQLHRHALANQMAQEEFQGSFLKSEGKPGVLLKHPNNLSDDAAKRLKASWDSVKAGGTAVLEEGISVEKWTMPLEDAQFVEQLQHSNLQVALMFLLPPGRLGAPSGDSMRYSTTELEGINFVTYTLQRRLRRIEGAVNRDPSIFTTSKFFCEFLVDALQRADSKTRAQNYMLALKGGWMTKDEVRAREGLPPLEEGTEGKEEAPSTEPPAESEEGEVEE